MNVLQIPEIIITVIKHLTALDILNTIKVCKCWNDTITKCNSITMHILLSFAKISTIFDDKSLQWQRTNPFRAYLLPIFDPIAYNIMCTFSSTSSFQLYSRLLSTNILLHQNMCYIFTRDIYAIMNMLNTQQTSIPMAMFRPSLFSFFNIFPHQTKTHILHRIQTY